jgi:hypothetical protein
MVTPLTIVTALTEMSIDRTTFQEGLTAGIHTTLKAQIIVCTRGFSALYQNHIYISRSLRQDLSASDVSLYEHNILAEQDQNCSLYIRMTEGNQLTETYCQSRRESSQSCCIVRYTLDDKSSAQVSFCTRCYNSFLKEGFLS